MNDKVQRSFWNRLKIRHDRNIKKGLYGYMWKTSLKIILIYLAIMIPALLISNYLLDLNAVFDFITTRFKDWVVLTVFFISEVFLGMIPPDFFVIWSTKFNSPLLFLSILGVLSYAGGAISYYLGVLLLKGKRIKAWSERVLSKYIGMVRKWGGAFIVISALFPFSPFSIVVIAVSLFKYPFKLYLLYGVARIARFLIQGYFYIGVIDVESIFG
ncbi:MAG TPA: short-chain dehydrogenase [Bacteroidales bacterium]|nr:short-chain dehydrogenase [Bacteroidales bacterium]HBZ20003.1 short-chain dehydrogenase [Bacteroidales bacterium]